MTKPPNAEAATWQNWSGNLKHVPPTDGTDNYFYPKNLQDLQSVIATARAAGVPVRASGQRHSQPPLVAGDNQANPPAKIDQFIVDMACFIDIGTTGMMLGPGKNQVTFNPGVREDDLDAFLTQNNLMMKTVTAGGFFSLGGMTAVDVHGATVAQPIFAETACAFTLIDADGNQQVIDATTPSENGWSPLQFIRVSLGGLGIVTRITLDVEPRPYATTLVGSDNWFQFNEKSDFVQRMDILLNGTNKVDRIEVFYTPYGAADNLPPLIPKSDNCLVLSWTVDDDPVNKVPNRAPKPADACTLAAEDKFGAPGLGAIAEYSLPLVRASQLYDGAYGLPGPALIAKIGMDEIKSQMEKANEQHSDLWLSGAAQVMFMSYFIELPDLKTKGLGIVWDGLQAAGNRTIQDGKFHLAAPLEFRFIKGGDSAMAGTYTDTPGATFVNLDLIGFVESGPSADYPAKLLQFFADVEKDWVAMGGFPHNGKMYGFYDPSQPNAASTGAFNPSFLADLRKRRGKRLQAFSAYRKKADPHGVFYNTYLRQLLES